MRVGARVLPLNGLNNPPGYQRNGGMGLQDIHFCGGPSINPRSLWLKFDAFNPGFTRTVLSTKNQLRTTTKDIIQG